MTASLDHGPKSEHRGSIYPGGARAIRAWVVDDSPLQLEAARAALAERCEVTVFLSGSAALEQLSMSEKPPDVFVLDWNMPEMTGAEVCAFLRTSSDAASLPILVLTATTTREGVQDALSAGANDFVRKPFVAEELQARVESLARTKLLHAKLLTAERLMKVEAEFRERFIGMLAHDLRQPLNTVFMASQLQRAASAEGRKFADMQLRAAQRMKRMIGELLDFTRNRPDTGLPLDRRPVDFAAVASAVVEEIQVANPQVDLHLSIDGNCEGTWDSDRLAQVCSNLIGNGIEHRIPETPVSVMLHGSKSEVLLVVSNRSEPIPESALGALFAPFRRGVGKASTGGLGLGLHIVSQIVTAHGGTVSAGSDQHGTHFRVTLPKA
ncbi:MAG: hybrid sensor histidine kinase/response regulator [Myxococcales bacterium]|nr:MAG: hybrid sensor histidine kinase/response regulator [Myxococcales bacterium]